MSLHLGGIAGSVTVFVLLFGPILLMLIALGALVGWARWRGTNTHPCQPLRVAICARSWLRLQMETLA